MKHLKYRWPIKPKYKVVEHDKYGFRENHYVLFIKREHSGFDITADYGTKIKSITKGIVLKTGFDGSMIEGQNRFNMGYGNYVEVLTQDNKRILYGHLSEIFVKKGQKVNWFTTIGKTGCSGGSRIPHLHIEIRKTNTNNTGLKNTINPLDLLPKKNLEKLSRKFIKHPYCNLWNKLESDNPWDFSKKDVFYAEDRDFIK